MSADAIRRPRHERSAMTPRELVQEVLGEDHALCTPLYKGKSVTGAIEVHCSCGAIAFVEPTAVNRRVLMNVSDVPS